MKTSAKRIAPGPAGHWLWGSLREFRRDVLGLMMESARSYGDVVRFRLGPQIVHLLNHPDHVQHVLQRRHRNYDKRTRSAAFIKAVTGESLLTANGEFWQRQRQLMQPAFHRQGIAAFAADMADATRAMHRRWRAAAMTGTPMDIAIEMSRLTYGIVTKTLFSTEAGRDAEAISAAMQTILPQTFDRLGNLLNWPVWAPTPQNVRFKRALRSVDEVVFRIITQHRAARARQPAEDDGDLLGMLMGVRDQSTGEGLSDRQLRNETITFLLAGHETTANALTWAFHLISRHPEVEQALRDEADAVLGDRPPGLADLPRLALTRRVVMEAMRLYPPIWIIERRVVAEDEIGGFHLPAGSAVVISPYALHRHPAFWDEPARFDPGRFAGGVSEAYLPFGAGPRFCIGREFAMMEAQIIVAMTVQAFHLRMVPGHPVEPWPGITLRARHGMMMTATGRAHFH